MPATTRKIIHVDMDAFFAAVEQRDDPALRGRPVAVGGSGPRGVVAAASYEARAFGVHSAMASVVARRRCPELIFVPHRFDVYKAVSRQVRAIFAEFTPIVEPLSLDEAYLDVSAGVPGLNSATEIAEAIRVRIHAETGLTASAGVSCNKLLAKLASDHRKPDGLTVIPPARGPAFVAALAVGRLRGIGPKTAAKMNRLGVFTGADLRARSLDELIRRFGKTGAWYYDIVRAIDDRPVSADRPRKSIGSETTFDTDLTRHDELVAALEPAIDSVWRHCQRADARGRTVTVKVKYADFRLMTRSRTGAEPVGDRETLAAVGRDLLGLVPLDKGIRLLGLTLSNFGGREAETPQLALDL